MPNIRRSASVFPYRGKWRVQYVDLFGKTRTLTCDNRQSAYLALSEIEGQMRSGFLNLKGASLPTFATWLSYWLDSRKSELNPTTWHGYEASCRRWLTPLLGALRIDALTPRHIQDLYHHLQTNHELATGTIRRIHSLLSSAFKLALLQGVVVRNPLVGVRQPRLSKKPIEVFSHQEVAKLLEVAALKTPREHLRWIFALRYGMRQGEVLGLKFSDFDLVSKTLTIRRTVNSLPGKGVVEPLSSLQASWSLRTRRTSWTLWTSWPRFTLWTLRSHLKPGFTSRTIRLLGNDFRSFIYAEIDDTCLCVGRNGCGVTDAYSHH